VAQPACAIPQANGTRALDYGISLAVLALAPHDVSSSGRPKLHSGVSRREIGAEIRHTLSPVLHGIIQGLEGQRAAERAAVDALAIPFTPVV
jgi:hypothetical protein